MNIITFRELKDEILSLGFETNDSYQEDENIMITAINRSINAISFEYKPFYKTLNIEVLEKSASINLKKMDSNYLKLSKIYKTVNYQNTGMEYEILDKSEEYIEYTQLLNNTIIVYSKGLYTFVYETVPPQVDINTSDSFEFDFDVATRMLVPLLAGFYLYRDDDATKADIYYNDYEMKLNKLKLEESEETAIISKGVEI